MTYRKIKHFFVFIVTSIFGIFAYVWLLLVLLVITPQVVDLWEAVLTFFMFPLLIISAYAADKGFVCAKNRTSSEVEIGFGKFKYILVYCFLLTNRHENVIYINPVLNLTEFRFKRIL